MSESPTSTQKQLSESMKIFIKASPSIQKAIKECLDEERLVMNMLVRHEIKKKLVQIIRNTSNKD